MGGFRRLLSTKPAPRYVRKLPPSAFADTWAERPGEPVNVGLRSISEEELSKAIYMATKTAWEDFPDAATDPDLRLEAYNDNLITNVLARALVDEKDIDRPYFAPAPEVRIRAALTSGGIRHLWSAYQETAAAGNPVGEQASADDVAALRSALEGVDAASASARALRLAKLLLDELKAVPGDE